MARAPALAALDAQLDRETARYLRRAHSRLSGVSSHSADNFACLARTIRADHAALTSAEIALAKDAPLWFSRLSKKLTDCEAMLQACDPEVRLKKGYSIVTDHTGKIIIASRDVNVHDIIGVRLSSGSLKTKVEEVD